MNFLKEDCEFVGLEVVGLTSVLEEEKTLVKDAAETDLGNDGLDS